MMIDSALLGVIIITAFLMGILLMGIIWIFSIGLRREE